MVDFGVFGIRNQITFFYSGGFTSIISGDIAGNSQMLSQIGTIGTFYINFTLPGGADSIPNLLAYNPGAAVNYLGIGLRTFDGIDGVNDLGTAYFNGQTSLNAIFTAAFPYNYSSYGPAGLGEIPYGEFDIYYNSNLTGVSDFVTIDSLSIYNNNDFPEPACLSVIAFGAALLMRRRTRRCMEKLTV